MMTGAPYKLPADSQLPYTISLNVVFTARNYDVVGRHGGIYLTNDRNSRGRGHSHTTLRQGATTSVIDWIDRFRDAIRIYGVDHPNPNVVMYFPLKGQANPPNQWTLLFFINTQNQLRCAFYADGQNVAEFEPVTSNGYMGFYAYANSRMTVSNLKITPLGYGLSSAPATTQGLNAASSGFVFVSERKTWSDARAHCRQVQYMSRLSANSACCFFLMVLHFFIGLWH